MSQGMRTVYLADRDHAYRRALAHALRRRGAEVVEFSSGSALYAEALVGRPDLILLEADLEEMDGFQVFARLGRKRRQDPVRVIFLTSFEHPRVALACRAHGALDYLVKGDGGPDGEAGRVLACLVAGGRAEPGPDGGAMRAPVARDAGSQEREVTAPAEREESSRGEVKARLAGARDASLPVGKGRPRGRASRILRAAVVGSVVLSGAAALGVLATHGHTAPGRSVESPAPPAPAPADSLRLHTAERVVVALQAAPESGTVAGVAEHDGPSILNGAGSAADDGLRILGGAGSASETPPSLAATAGTWSRIAPVPTPPRDVSDAMQSSPAARVGSRRADGASDVAADRGDGSATRAEGVDDRPAGGGARGAESVIDRSAGGLVPTYEFLAGIGLAAPPGGVLDGPNSDTPVAILDGLRAGQAPHLVFTFRTESDPSAVESFYARSGVRFNRRVVPMGGRFQGVAREVSRGTHRAPGGVETTITVSRPGVDAAGKVLVPETSVRLDVRRPPEAP